jgi:biotin carboxyl carrier protein
MVRERAERGSVNSSEPSQNVLSVAELRQLITLLNTTDLEELTIEQEASGLRLVLRKPPVQATSVTIDELETPEVAEMIVTEAELAEKMDEVRAPLVGVFRASLKPGGRPLAAEGDVVRAGQVVGAIEALNVLNEVEAQAAGRVKEILVLDGQAVEYGQSLLVIDPMGQ